MVKYRNVHGRKGGRGLRPWLLIPKVLGAGTYFGGLIAAAAVIGGFYANAGGEATRQQWVDLANTLRAIFVYAAVPGVTIAILCGVALLWHSGWALWRMRWMKVKATVVVLTIPVLHLFMSGRLAEVREAGAGGAAMTQFNIGLAAAIVMAGLVIFLGRHKPRLGQGVRPVTRRRPAEGDRRDRLNSDTSEQQEGA